MFHEDRASRKQIPYITDRKIWGNMGDTLWREIWQYLHIDTCTSFAPRIPFLRIYPTNPLPHTHKDKWAR